MCTTGKLLNEKLAEESMLTDRQLHNSEETKELFQKHLEYLFSLCYGVRSERKDYQEMVNFLKKEGHWRRKKTRVNKNLIKNMGDKRVRRS